MTRTRRLVASFGYNLTGLGLAAGAQLIYTALSARMVAPAGFGEYASAVVAVGLVNLLVGTGMTASVLRSATLAPHEVAQARGRGLVLGLVGAGLLVCGAPLWASVSGIPEATSLVRLLAFSTALMPLYAISVGQLRRAGRARDAAVVELSGAIGGVAIGIATIAATRSALSLASSTIAATWLGLALASCLLSGDLRIEFRKPPGHVRGFSSRVTWLNLGYYTLYNLPTLAVGRIVGTAMLGQWSRGYLLASFPASQGSAALLRSVYPELRHLEDETRLMASATDALVVVAFFGLPAFSALSALSEPLTRLMLGAGWLEAASVLAILAWGFGVSLLASLAGSTLEYRGRFRGAFVAQALAAVVVLFGLGEARAHGSIEAAAWTLTLMYFTLHAAQLAVLMTSYRHDTKRLLAGYGYALTLAVVTWGQVDAALMAGRGRSLAFNVCLMMIVVSVDAAAIWALRKRIPALRILAARTGGTLTG